MIEEVSMQSEALAASAIKKLPTALKFIDKITRHRRLSVSSSSSSTSESVSSTSRTSTALALDGDEVKDIFRTYKNIPYNSGFNRDNPTPTFRLAFSSLPYINQEDGIWQHRNPGSLRLQDDLNPDAAPFVPQSASHKVTRFSSINLLPESRILYHTPNNGFPLSHLNLRILDQPQVYDEPLDLDAWPSKCIPPTAPPPSSVIQIRAPLLDDSPAVPPGLGLEQIQVMSIHGDPERTPRPWLNSVKDQHIPPPPARLPVWLTPFLYGLNPAIDSAVREFNAQAVVSSIQGHWRDEDFVELAAHFSWRAYGDTEDTGDNLAAFAGAIFRAFDGFVGPEAAQTFIWNLREAVFSNFTSSWDPVTLDALLCDLDSLSLHVISSISLARFIGDLFLHNLVTRPHVAACISKVFENMASEEHIVAIGQLVVRSGPGLWACVPQVNGHIVDFLNKFADLARGVQKSMLGREVGYARGWIEVVVEDLREWEACLMGRCVMDEHEHVYADLGLVPQLPC